MENNERLAEIIRADWNEDEASCKKLNIEKLLESDIIDRVLDFLQAYDELFDKNVFDTATSEWLKYGKEDYNCIKYFLMTSASEYTLPFRIEDFISMTPDELAKEQEKCAKIFALLDEKRALYEEFLTFYE